MTPNYIKNLVVVNADMIETIAGKMKAAALDEGEGVRLQDARAIEIIASDLVRLLSVQEQAGCCAECERAGRCPVEGSAPCELFVRASVPAIAFQEFQDDRE